MNINEQDQGDYVLVHKTKAKISRARKGVMGMMVVGAIAALAGGGTFASFSASTTNDGTFKTGVLRLSNTVNSGTACFSSATDVDENAEDCDELFSAAFMPGVANTVNVDVSNAGTTAAALKLFGTGAVNACTDGVNDLGFDGIQQIVSTGASTDSFTLTYGANTTGSIAWDATAADVETALTGLLSIGADNVGVTRTGSGPYTYTVTFKGALSSSVVTKIAATPTGGTATVSVLQGGFAPNTPTQAGTEVGQLCEFVKITVQETLADHTTAVQCELGGNLTACPAVDLSTAELTEVPVFSGTPIDLDTTFEPGETKYYVISMELPENSLLTDVPGCANLGDDFGTNGVGCDNPLQNGKAAINLRWQLQA